MKCEEKKEHFAKHFIVSKIFRITMFSWWFSWLFKNYQCLPMPLYLKYVVWWSRKGTRTWSILLDTAISIFKKKLLRIIETTGQIKFPSVPQFQEMLSWHHSISNCKKILEYLICLVFSICYFRLRNGWWWKLSIRMFLKLRNCQIIWYLFPGFTTIILCSVHSIWFIKYLLSAKKWF